MVTYAASFSNSKENDYDADTASFSISQDMFGDLTTVQLSFSRGKDDVTRRGDPTFAQKVDRHIYGIDVSQIVSKKLILAASWETTTEEGFLNNPYRRVRFVDAGVPLGYSYEFERYPRTRTGNAIGLRGRYYLPYRAAVQGDYRWYNDTWGIDSNTFEVSYTQPVGDHMIFDAHFRYYMQGAADFYSDLFPRANFQNFLARDKELSKMDSQTLGFGVGYEFKAPWARFIQKATVNLKYDFIRFNYDDFRDLRPAGFTPGTSPCTASTPTSCGSSSRAGSRESPFRPPPGAQVPSNRARGRRSARPRRPHLPVSRSARGPVQGPSRRRFSSGPRSGSHWGRSP